MNEQTQTAAPTPPPTISAATLQQLRAVPILATVPEREIVCLTDSTQVHLNSGEFIARQGEAAHFFWIVLSGSLRLYQVLPDGREVPMATAPPGTACGELPLLANIPNIANVVAAEPCELLQFNEQQFWNIMTSCPEVRKAILGNMALRFQRYQSSAVQQEKMASLGTLAAGLMHELNNPGAAAVRAAAQLRENLLRMHRLTAKFSKAPLKDEQKQCMFDLQEYALSKKDSVPMNSLEQSDAEEALAEWMENANIDDAWKLAPSLVAVGLTSTDLECARAEFPSPYLSDALNWLEALVSSMQLVGTIEESVGRVSSLVKAVKSYAYEGKGQKQSVNVNESIYATLVILGHKLREKQITLKKDFTANLPALQCECSGLNQIWTNILDNAIDAVSEGGHIRIRTWQEDLNPASSDPQDPNPTPIDLQGPNPTPPNQDPTSTPANQAETTAPSARQDNINPAPTAPTPSPAASPKPQSFLCITIADDGPGIPLESQPRIFDPFYTTKPVGVGTGLGLGIVQRIVEQYRGVITFSSEPGNTEFRIRLPLTRD